MSDRARERVQTVWHRGYEWKTDHSTDISETRRRKGRRVIKSNPDVVPLSPPKSSPEVSANTGSSTWVRHLQRALLAAIVEFFAQTLWHCNSYSWVSSTKISAESESPPQRSLFHPFPLCLLLLLLLLACLLLLVERGSTTLHPKKGYKTSLDPLAE